MLTPPRRFELFSSLRFSRKPPRRFSNAHHEKPQHRFPCLSQLLKITRTKLQINQFFSSKTTQQLPLQEVKPRKHKHQQTAILSCPSSPSHFQSFKSNSKLPFPSAFISA
ncbi:hypothetical protein Droror1_Dr00018804 [Drosera rotundifolia]